MVVSELTRYQESRKVTVIGMFINSTLALLKILVGIIGGSSALFVDGIHSFADLFSDVMVLVAAKYASKEVDSNHPYGHERIETLATVILSAILIFIAFFITFHTISKWVTGQLIIADKLTLYVVILSILANEGLFRYTMIAANKIDSNLLRANAWHSRSDMWSSLVVLVGFLGSNLGLTWMDALAAIVVSIMIGKMGALWCYRALSELVDTGVEDKLLQSIKRAILRVDGVNHYHQLRTRKMAGKVLLDVHIVVDSYISASEGHNISEHVKKSLVSTVDNIKDITIHVDVNEYHGEAPIVFPSRIEIFRQLRAYISEKSKYCDLYQIEMFVYYYPEQIELYLLVPEHMLQTLNLINVKKFSIDGINSTTVKLFSSSSR